MRRKRELASLYFSGIFIAAIFFPFKMFIWENVFPMGSGFQILIMVIYMTKKMALSHNRVLRLSKDLQVMNESLEMLVDERTKYLNFANETLKKLNFAKDRFISILSHDLRNPLNSLIGLSRRLITNAEKNEKEKIISYSRMINESASACHSLTENLLDWALIQSGESGVVPQKINLRDAVIDVFNLVRNESELKCIELVNNVEVDCKVYADIRMVESILRNLVTNGIKFTPHNGKIEISAKLSDLFCEISIADTGIEMEKDELKNLFRVDKKVYNLGTDDEPGSGFGLILTQEFVKSNGGTISVKSEKEKGTTVTFTLPVYNLIYAVSGKE